MEFIPYAFIAIVLLLVIVIPISINNQIIQLKNLVKRNWADVLAQERMKLKLMPELEKLAKTYQEYEKGLFEKVAALRTTISAIANSDDTGSDS
jgi:LemA protein